jgi:hypothetical protein
VAFEGVVDEGRTEGPDEQPDRDTLHDPVDDERDDPVRHREQAERQRDAQAADDQHGLAADVVGQAARDEQAREQAGDVDGEDPGEHERGEVPLGCVDRVDRRRHGRRRDRDQEHRRQDPEPGDRTS